MYIFFNNNEFFLTQGSTDKPNVKIGARGVFVGDHFISNEALDAMTRGRFEFIKNHKAPELLEIQR